MVADLQAGARRRRLRDQGRAWRDASSMPTASPPRRRKSAGGIAATAKAVPFLKRFTVFNVAQWRLRRQFGRVLLWQRRLHGDRRLCVGAARRWPQARSPVFLPDLPKLLADQQWPAPAGALAGGATAAAIGALVGFPLMRLSGISASIATFSIWSSFMSGSATGPRSPAARTRSWGCPQLCRPLDRDDLGSCRHRDRLRLSGIARRIAAARLARGRSRGEGRRRRYRRHRWIAFTLSAFLSGVSGVLPAHFLGTVRVETFYLDLTFLIIAMLVIGGARSLTGAVAGALRYRLLTELLREAEVGFRSADTRLAHRRAGRQRLALLMLVIILFRPKGIAGGREKSAFLCRDSVRGGATTCAPPTPPSRTTNSNSPWTTRQPLRTFDLGSSAAASPSSPTPGQHPQPPHRVAHVAGRRRTHRGASRCQDAGAQPPRSRRQ